MTKTRNITAVVAIGLTLAGVGLGWYGAHADAQGGVPTGQARDSAAHQLGKQVPTRELESEWLMEKAEVGGKISPDIGWLKNGLRWLIRGDNITIQRFGQSTIGTISVDLKKSPREIDIHLVEGPVPDERVYRGIYKREDMRLTVCYAAAGEPRPTAFATKAGSSAMLAVFRWTEGRTHGPVPSGRDVIYPPAQYVPQKKSSGGSKRQLGDMTPYVAPLPEVQLLNPYLPPAVMPGGPIQVAPVQLRVNPYTVPLQVNPYTVPLQINPYTAPPPVFKPLQLPPFELPKDAPPPRKRPDGSKDA